MDVNPSDRDNHSGPERKDSPAVVGTSPRGAKRCESLRRRRGAKRRTHVLRTIADEGLLLASHERIESPGGWPFSGSALSRPLSSGGAQRAFESKQRRSGAFAPSSAEPTVSPRNEQRRAAGANALPPFSPQLCRIHSRSCRDSRISRQGAAGAKVAFAFANALTPSESRLLRILPVERAGEASGSKAPYPSHSFPPTLRHPFRVRGPGIISVRQLTRGRIETGSLQDAGLRLAKTPKTAGVSPRGSVLPRTSNKDQERCCIA